MHCSFDVGQHGQLDLIRKKLQDTPEEVNAEDFASELCFRLEVKSVDHDREAEIFTELRSLLPEKKVKPFDCKVIDLTKPHFQHFYCTQVLSTFTSKQERGEWLEDMLSIFGKTETFKKLLRTSTQIELVRSKSSETLFREDSLSNTLALSICNDSIQKNVNSFFTFLKKQRKWPKGYVVNNAHLKEKTVTKMAQNKDRFQKLVTSFAASFLKKQKVNATISEILKIRASSVKEQGYGNKEGERASASLYWLRFFGSEIMKRFEASGKAPDDPEWSVILTFQKLLTKVSSACPFLTVEEQLADHESKISAPHFDREWSKEDYRKLMQKCYEIVLPHFNNYMKRLSRTYIKHEH